MLSKGRLVMQADLTTEDVAATLRLNRATVQRMLHSGRLKGYQVGRTWRVPVEAVNEFRSQAVKRHVWAGPVPDVVPIDSKKNHAEWEALLRRADGLAHAPSIPDWALRREYMYEDCD